MADEHIPMEFYTDDTLAVELGEVNTIHVQANYNQTDPTQKDYIKGRDNILGKEDIKGIGENSIATKTTVALGENSVAIGERTIAGANVITIPSSEVKVSISRNEVPTTDLGEQLIVGCGNSSARANCFVAGNSTTLGDKYIKIGKTVITEAQLIKLLALIE